MLRQMVNHYRQQQQQQQLTGRCVAVPTQCQRSAFSQSYGCKSAIIFQVIIAVQPLTPQHQGKPKTYLVLNSQLNYADAGAKHL